MSWRPAFVVSILASLVWPRTSFAEPTVGQCIDSSEAGQRQRDAGHLLAARRELLTCSAATCPTPVARDCARWYEELEHAIPSIVFSVRDDGGRDVPRARVTIDAAVVELAGRPVAIDPGEHRVVAEGPGFARSEHAIVVLTGEKNRVVIETLTRASPLSGGVTSTARTKEEPPQGKATSPWLAAGALAGLGVVALSASTYFGLTARGDLADAKASPCAATQSCEPAVGRSIDRRLLVADVTLATGAVALVAAGLWLLLHRASP